MPFYWLYPLPLLLIEQGKEQLVKSLNLFYSRSIDLFIQFSLYIYSLQFTDNSQSKATQVNWHGWISSSVRLPCLLPNDYTSLQIFWKRGHINDQIQKIQRVPR